MVTSTARALIIEDDQWFADSLAKYLSAQLPRLAVRQTGDPRRAIDLIDQWQPFVVIADVHLGATNVVTLLNELASYPDTLAIPKVILSSSGDQLSAEDLRAFGVQAVYDKRHYDPVELVQLIRRVGYVD